MSTTTTELTAPKDTSLKGLLSQENIKEQISRALPTHLSADRFLRIAMTALLKTPKLAQCSQASFMKCLLDLSSLGLEPDGRRAHLIPYGTEATLIIDYKGLSELAMRSGIVANIHADVICENDKFSYNKGQVMEHTIDFKQPRGAVYAAYATCRFKDGTEKSEVMDKGDIEGIRKRSKSGSNGPWVTDWNEMAKKTVFRRLSKWLPISAEFRDAVEKDDDLIPERDVTPTIPTIKPKALAIEDDLGWGDTDTAVEEKEGA